MALASGLALILTAVWRDWIEIVFRLDFDNHSGSMESLVVLLCAAVTITFMVLARHEWRRTHPVADRM